MAALDLLTGRYGPGPNAPPPSPASGGISGATQNHNKWASRPTSNYPLLGQQGSPMLRGFMTTPTGIKPKITLNFMYNPPEINASYDTDESKMIPIETQIGEDPAAVEGIPMLVGGASMSFALVFDRTVEVASGNKKTLVKAMATEQSDPRELGVLHDLGVLERLIGAVGSGQIISNPVEVNFSRRSKRPGLNFKGYILGASTYFGGSQGMFNQYMIPTRATVSLVIRRIFIPSPSASGSTGPIRPTKGDPPTSSRPVGAPGSQTVGAPGSQVVGAPGSRSWGAP